MPRIMIVDPGGAAYETSIVKKNINRKPNLQPIRKRIIGLGGGGDALSHRRRASRR